MERQVDRMSDIFFSHFDIGHVLAQKTRVLSG